MLFCVGISDCSIRRPDTQKASGDLTNGVTK
jgi:hypothetical protein